VTLLGQYDFAHSEWGGVVLDGAVHPWRSVAARFNARFDPERTRIDEGMLEFAWRSDAGHRVGLRYRYLREIPDLFGAFPRENDRFKNFRSDFDRINQIGASIRVALTERWAVGYRGAYSFERSLFLANTGTLEYVSGCGCWAAAVDVSEDRSRGAAIRLRYTLTGLGKVAERPFDAGAPIDFGSLDALGGV
jgi:lipopolysaccharide assembly outer membrane protein LptD (OstA)